MRSSQNKSIQELLQVNVNVQHQLFFTNFFYQISNKALANQHSALQNKKKKNIFILCVCAVLLSIVIHRPNEAR